MEELQVLDKTEEDLTKIEQIAKIDDKLSQLKTEKVSENHHLNSIMVTYPECQLSFSMASESLDGSLRRTLRSVTLDFRIENTIVE